MIIRAVFLTRWNSDSIEPIILDAAYNLLEYNYFTRNSVKEFLTAAAATLMKRLTPGVHCVDFEGNMCFCSIGTDGFGAIAVCDKEYPARVAVALLKEVSASFKAEFGTRWRSATADNSCKYPRLEAALLEYQEPTKVDKIAKLDKQLGETKDILYKTIDAVLARGEKLDDLVEKSSKLSEQSKVFYKQAKKTNSCCTIC